MIFLSRIISILKSLLAILLGFLVLGLTIFPSGIVLEAVFPGSIGPDNFPVTLSSQILLLTIEFIAVSAATLVVVLAAPRSLNIHAIIFGAFILIGTIFTIIAPASAWPLWMSVILLVGLPFQIRIGLWLGKYIKDNDQGTVSRDQ